MGLLAGGLAAGAAVVGLGAGLARGDAPSGYEYIYNNGSVGSNYSFDTPIWIIGFVILFVGGMIGLDAGASQPFVEMMERLDRGKVWVAAYSILNISAFMGGAILFIAMAQKGAWFT